MLLKISFVGLAWHKKAFPRWCVILIGVNKHLLTYVNWRLSKVLGHFCFHVRFKELIRIYAMWNNLKKDTFNNYGKDKLFYDGIHIDIWELTRTISLLLVKMLPKIFFSAWFLQKRYFQDSIRYHLTYVNVYWGTSIDVHRESFLCCHVKIQKFEMESFVLSKTIRTKVTLSAMY